MVHSVSEWKIRAADAGDEDGLVFHWLKSFAHSQYGRARGADVDRSPAELAYWEQHRHLVMSLLRSCDVSLVVDPAAPYVFWAMLCAEENRVHYILAKRIWHNADRDDGTTEVASMFRALLGPRLETAQSVSHELPELRRAGMRMPLAWRLDPYAAFRRAA